jgi:hypothetical protein
MPGVLDGPVTQQKLRHLFWEMKVDRWFARAYSLLAHHTIRMMHEDLDEVLKGEHPISRGVYGLKKRIYKNGLFLSGILPQLELIQELRPKNRHAKAIARNALKVSKMAILSVLLEGKASWVTHYDPLGGDGYTWA